MSYELHIYEASDGYRWGLVAENHEKLGHGGQGYSNRLDLEAVVMKLFVPDKPAFFGQLVPWHACSLHESKSGKCYIHLLKDASSLEQSIPAKPLGQPLS